MALLAMFVAFSVLFSVHALTCLPSEAESARAFFVYGLVDSGNSDFLATAARADAYLYGIDSPSHTPSGRFSNGYNLRDLINNA